MGKREKLARIIHAAQYMDDWNSAEAKEKHGPRQLSQQDFAFATLDALLAELREPTEEMLEAVARGINKEWKKNGVTLWSSEGYSVPAANLARAAIAAFVDKAGEE